MKKIMLSILILCSFSHLFGRFELPPEDRHYNETTFLAAHNAYAAFEYGFIYPQQLWNVEKQLEYGVRCFLLDTHAYNGLMQSTLNSLGSFGSWGTSVFGKNDPFVALCHGSCDLTATVLRPGSLDAMKLKSILKDLRSFLEANPNEIITLILENEVKDGDLLDDAFEIVKSYILKPSDFNPQGATKWPTLKWMKDTNKRLVIFADHVYERSNYIYDQWPVMAENEFSSINFDKVCQERGQSARYRYSRRNLLLFNFFPAAPVPVEKEDYSSLHTLIDAFEKLNFTRINSRRLKRAINLWLTQGAYPQRYPNFIALDFVDCGNPIEFVNLINRQANDPEKRNEMYQMIRSSN